MSAPDDTPSQPPAGRASSQRLEQGAVSDASITAIHAQLRREKPEPTEGFSPIPIVILFVFSALIFFGGIYVGTKSGEFSPLAFDVTRNYGEASQAAAPKEVDMMKLGARLYGQTCVACHQPTGQGVPQAYPPLAGSPYVLGNEERIIRIVSNGLSGPIEVEGNSFNGAMPPFHGSTSAYRFNEQKIAAVLTYVRASWGNNAPPVTTDKVKEVLTAIGSRSTPWTVQELAPFE
jgi:mono/diheme cytochrome c family protein